MLHVNVGHRFTGTVTEIGLMIIDLHCLTSFLAFTENMDAINIF
jgi:hypothetical protein